MRGWDTNSESWPLARLESRTRNRMLFFYFFFCGHRNPGRIPGETGLDKTGRDKTGLRGSQRRWPRRCRASGGACDPSHTIDPPTHASETKQNKPKPPQLTHTLTPTIISIDLARLLPQLVPPVLACFQPHSLSNSAPLLHHPRGSCPMPPRHVDYCWLTCSLAWRPQAR